MRKKRSFSLSQRPSWFMLCCLLLQIACDDGSVVAPQGASPEAHSVSSSPHGSHPDNTSPIGYLSEDSLVAPEQPTLSVTAQPGALNFQWQAGDGQVRARLYRHDPLLCGEILTHESKDPTTGSWQLPSQTHARPWHRQQYRIELCTVDDCVSSPRVSLENLAPNTVDTLTPAVFVAGERYADQIALNDTATLAVMTLPVEGALEFRVRNNGQWILIQRLRLDDLTISGTRTLDVALSESGDTVAVLVRNGNDPAEREIRILERLGEAWLETAVWPVAGAMAATTTQVSVDAHPVSTTPHTAITLSSDGTQILLHSERSLLNYRQAESEWSEVPYRLDSDGWHEDRIQGSTALLVASAHSARLHRVFTLVEEHQQLYLSVWTPSAEASFWQHRARFPIRGLNPNAPLSIISNAAGSTITVAGWENTGVQNHTPVMWRYSVESAFPETLIDTFSLRLMDSLRAPPTEHVNPALIFTANASLTLVALGWHTTDDPADTSAILPDAALNTYVYNAATRQWLSALELPQDLPTLTSQSFVVETILSSDGTTMMMTRSAGNAASRGTPAGEVLVMR